MDGLITYRALPTGRLEHLDPFILLNHHGPQVYPANNQGLPFGPHPHRGFETLTFVLEGDVMHEDSTGHKSTIGAGGVQWMTAGKGIVHSEVSSPEFKKTGGPIEILQLWMNLPAKLKMTDPGYQGLNREDMVHFGEKGIQFHLISGELSGNKGPVKSLTGLTLFHLEMEEGSSTELPVPADHEVLFYLNSGELDILDQKIPSLHSVQFSSEGETIQVKASLKSSVIAGFGRPNREPIVAYGPFVMNSMEEIQEAIFDYQKGKFN